MPETDFNKHMRLFFKEFLPEKKSSPRTILSYDRTLKAFVRFLHETKDLEAKKVKLVDFTAENVRLFLDTLVAKGNLPNTVNQRQAAFATFAKYLEVKAPRKRDQFTAITKLPFLPVVRKPISYLKAEAIDLFLGQIDASKPEGLRDLLMMQMILLMGLRVSEVLTLTCRSVQLLPYDAHIMVPGANGVAHKVPIPESVFEPMQRFLATKGLPENLDGFLFVNYVGKPMTRNGLNYVVCKYRNLARQVNPDLIPANLTARMLRHTWGASIASAGCCATVIRDLLGQRSLNAAKIYVRAYKKDEEEDEFGDESEQDFDD